MQTKVFISYRRADTALLVGRICDHLENHFGMGSVFLDVDGIPAGVDFRGHLRSTLASCAAALILIGPRWFDRTQDGRLRLEEEDDFVRLEIEAALLRDIPVVPVVLAGTSLPAPNELPASLRALLDRQSFPLDPGRDFRFHMDRLIKELTERGVAEVTIRGHSALFWAFGAGEFMLVSAASQVAREGGKDLGSPGGAVSLDECLDALGVQTRPSVSGGITDDLRTKARREIEQKHGQDAGEAFQLGWVTNLAAFVCGMPPALNAARHEIERICRRISVPRDIMDLYLPILDRSALDQRDVLTSLDLFKKRLLAWLDAK